VVGVVLYALLGVGLGVRPPVGYESKILNEVTFRIKFLGYINRFIIK